PTMRSAAAGPAGPRRTRTRTAGRRRPSPTRRSRAPASGCGATARRSGRAARPTAGRARTPSLSPRCSCGDLFFTPLPIDRLAENDSHDGDPEANGDVPDPECQQPIPGHGTSQCQSDERGRYQRCGDEKIEMRHPGPEHRSRLAVEVDRQGEKHALPDQEDNPTDETQPRERVEELNQLRVPFRAEGGEEPEEVGDEKQSWTAGRAPQKGIREDRSEEHTS